MSSFPSGPTFPCLNWGGNAIYQLHHSEIQLKNRPQCRDNLFTSIRQVFHLFNDHITNTYLSVEGRSLLNLALVESFAEWVSIESRVFVRYLPRLLKYSIVIFNAFLIERTWKHEIYLYSHEHTICDMPYVSSLTHQLPSLVYSPSG